MNEISVKTVEEEIQVSIDAVDFVFKKIKAGTFTMGASHFRHDAFPSHNVTISHDYWVQETLLTQQQWRVLKGKPIEEMLAESEFSEFNGIGDDYPIYLLTWHEAKQACQTLSDFLVDTNLQCTLATEAEWEFACGAGTYQPYSFGDALDGSQANCNGQFPYGQLLGGAYRGTTTPVKTFLPNQNGLYDMHGNLWEWCEDWYDESYYAVSPSVDPLGPKCGLRKVVRGGSWRSHAECCRTAFRDSDLQDYRGRTSGVRLVLRERS